MCYVLLCLFASVLPLHYTFFEYKNHIPCSSQKFYNTNSDNKNNTIDDVKFSMASDDHFVHLLTIRGNSVSLLRLCALQPGSGFDS